MLLVQGRLRDSEQAEDVDRRIEILIEDLTRLFGTRFGCSRPLILDEICRSFA